MKWLRKSRNIEPEELEVLDNSLARFYTDPPEIYHKEAAEANEDWNAIDHIFHRKITGRAYKGEKVLDVGCGPAMACPWFTAKGAHYTGIDLSKEQLEINRKTYPDSDFLYMHWKDIPKLGAVFDLVASFFVLEHIIYPRQYIKATSQCVKKNGLLAVLCPDFLKRGFLPSQHFFGEKPGGIKAKIKDFEWIEASIETFDRYIAYPRLIRKARREAKKDGAWLINLKPVCFDAKSWARDWDAVYMAGEDEVARHIESLGFKIIERGNMFHNAPGAEAYSEFCYVLGQKL